MTAAAAELEFGTSGPERAMARHLADTQARLADAVRDGDARAAADIREAAEEARDRAARDGLPVALVVLAAEAVRRAERAIAVIIRDGQAAGRIRRQGDATGRLPSARDLTGIRYPTNLYPLALATDEQFEAALAACRADQVMTRINVLRAIAAAGKPEAPWIPEPGDRSAAAVMRRRDLVSDMAARNMSSRQIIEATGISAETIRKIAAELRITIAADDVVRRTRRPDSRRIAADATASLEGLAAAVQLACPDDLDPAEKRDWADSMHESLTVLSRFAKTLQEQAQ